jgi:hypothetical protein
MQVEERLITADDLLLTGEPVLPDFSLSTSDVFKKLRS